MGIGLGGGGVGGYVDLHRDRRAECARDQAGHAADQLRQIDRGRSQRLPLGEGEQALDQRLGTIGRLHRAVDQPVFAIAADAAPLEHVERADDRGQQIVEIMRDAAGELAHRLQLLRLAQRLLGEPAAGGLDRLGDDRDDRPAAVGDRPHREIIPAPAGGRQFELDRLAEDLAARCAHEARADRIAHARRPSEPGRIPERPPDHGVERPLDRGQRGRIGVEQDAVAIHQRLEAEAGLEDRAEPILARAKLRGAGRDLGFQRIAGVRQLLVEVSPLGDVERDRKDRIELTVGRADRRDAVADPAFAAIGMTEPAFALERRAAVDQGGEFRGVAVEIDRAGQILDAQPQQLIARAAEHLAIAIVDEGEAALRVEIGNARGGLRDDRFHPLRHAQHVAGLRQRGLGMEPRADILRVVEGAEDDAIGIAQRRVMNFPVRPLDVRIAELLDDAEDFAVQCPRHEATDYRRLVGEEEIGKHVADLDAIGVDAEELVAMRLVETDQPEVAIEGADRAQPRLGDGLPQASRHARQS